MSDPFSCEVRELHNETLPPKEFVYIASNEVIPANVVRTLKSNTIPRACHLGVSGWYNFDIAVIRGSERIIIVDINPDQVAFMKQTLIAIVNASHRSQFVRGILEYIDRNTIRYGEPRTNTSKFFDYNLNRMDCNREDPSSVIYDELNRDGSWLSSDQSYRYIRQLALDDRIAVLTTNVAHVHTFASIIGTIYKYNYELDTVYVSNVPGRLQPADLKLFILTLRILHPRILIWATPDLVQRVDVNQLAIVYDTW